MPATPLYSSIYRSSGFLIVVALYSAGLQSECPPALSKDDNTTLASLPAFSFFPSHDPTCHYVMLLNHVTLLLKNPPWISTNYRIKPKFVSLAFKNL